MHLPNCTMSRPSFFFSLFTASWIHVNAKGPVTWRFIPNKHIHPAILLVIWHVHTGKGTVSLISPCHCIDLHTLETNVFPTASVSAKLALLYKAMYDYTLTAFGTFPREYCCVRIHSSTRVLLCNYANSRLTLASALWNVLISTSYCIQGCPSLGYFTCYPLVDTWWGQSGRSLRERTVVYHTLVPPTPGEGRREGLSTLLSHGVGLWRRGGCGGKVLSESTAARTNLHGCKGRKEGVEANEEHAQVQTSHTLPLPNAYPSRLEFPSLIAHLHSFTSLALIPILVSTYVTLFYTLGGLATADQVLL